MPAPKKYLFNCKHIFCESCWYNAVASPHSQSHSVYCTCECCWYVGLKKKELMQTSSATISKRFWNFRQRCVFETCELQTCRVRSFRIVHLTLAFHTNGMLPDIAFVLRYNHWIFAFRRNSIALIHRTQTDRWHLEIEMRINIESICDSIVHKHILCDVHYIAHLTQS